jgi:hypothetical protein
MADNTNIPVPPPTDTGDNLWLDYNAAKVIDALESTAGS